MKHAFRDFILSGLFKKIYNKTPHQYLIVVRLEHAKELLSGGLQVSEVCFSVGFESVSSFTGLFKRMVGCSPSVYRQQQLDRKAAISATPLKFIPNCFAEYHGWSKNSNFQEVA
jgi:AraC-like DNA-binding protein